MHVYIYIYIHILPDTFILLLGPKPCSKSLKDIMYKRKKEKKENNKKGYTVQTLKLHLYKKIMQHFIGQQDLTYQSRTEAYNKRDSPVSNQDNLITINQLHQTRYEIHLPYHPVYPRYHHFQDPEQIK